jgi:hypothetical protein
MIAARFDGVLSSGLGPRSRHDVGLSLVPPLNIRPVPKPFGVAIDRGGDHTVDLSRRGSLVYRRLGAYAPVLPQRRIVTLPLLGSSSIGPPTARSMPRCSSGKWPGVRVIAAAIPAVG